MATVRAGLLYVWMTKAQHQLLKNTEEKMKDFSAAYKALNSAEEKAATFPRNSAPGVDGLPYAAWAAAGRHGAETSMRLAYCIMAGFHAPMRALRQARCA